MGNGNTCTHGRHTTHAHIRVCYINRTPVSVGIVTSPGKQGPLRPRVPRERFIYDLRTDYSTSCTDYRLQTVFCVRPLYPPL